jgi:hypothetical protein
MPFTLTPQNGDPISVAEQDWHPTVELLEKHELISPEKLENLHYTGKITDLSAAESQKIHEFLVSFLEKLETGERLLLDITTTREIDTSELPKVDEETNYSAHKDWLVRFRDFCRDCGGFRIS